MHFCFNMLKDYNPRNVKFLHKHLYTPHPPRPKNQILNYNFSTTVIKYFPANCQISKEPAKNCTLALSAGASIMSKYFTKEETKQVMTWKSQENVSSGSLFSWQWTLHIDLCVTQNQMILRNFLISANPLMNCSLINNPKDSMHIDIWNYTCIFPVFSRANGHFLIVIKLIPISWQPDMEYRKNNF